MLAPSPTMFTESTLRRDVRRGLSAAKKSLPPHLFYDEEGSRLYEQITELEEYYPTRTESLILREHAAEIARLASPMSVVELGAGTATKTELLLRAIATRGERTTYLPIDVSPSALRAAKARLERALPLVDVRPFVGHHEDALSEIERLGTPRLVLFIGSSVGNFEDDEAVRLLRGMRLALGASDGLLLGTDLVKSPARLVAAYDDARGVTAAFNKNVLARINRELGGQFDLARFRHIALWNAAASRIEMHLESRVAQEVQIAALDLIVRLEAGERIHTESSIKYDLPRVDALLSAAGFARRRTFTDPEQLFAVHWAPAAGHSSDAS